MRNINDDDDIRKTFQARAGTNKDYLLEYILDDTKKQLPLSVFANAVIALENDEAFMDAEFAFDLLRNQELIKIGKDHILFTNKHLTDAQYYLQKHCNLKRISKSTTADAVFNVSKMNEKHPVRDYLNSIQWDGHPRIDEWLTICMGVVDNEYTRSVAAKTLIGMVARVMKPGCMCQYCPIFEGPQGIGKSTAVKILGGDYYSDNLPDLSDHIRASAHVIRYWVIEIPEMHVFFYGKIDQAHIKAFITNTHERYRRPWAIVEDEIPRQCYFIGTTNKDAYLRDETGDRRFWPVKCTKADTDWLIANRDQLFAEAVQRYRDGEAWHPTREEEARLFEPEQAKRKEVDELFNLVRDYLDDPLSRVTETTGVTVWRRIVGGSDKAIPNQSETQRLAIVFRELGFERAREPGTGRKIWKRIL